jgi:diguanylate cyclase (GGDEF)-like protein
MWFLNGAQTFTDLAQNAILLFALVFVYATTNFNAKTNIFRKILLGMLIGGFTVLIMLNPWKIEEGLFFDTRSVLLSVSGVFYGAIPTLIAGVIAAIYRIWVGGSGVYAGVLTIVVTVTLGLTWKYIRGYLPRMSKYLEFYLLGLGAHILTWLCFFVIPWPRAFEVLQKTAVPYLLVFPFVTMILALALENQKSRLETELSLKKQRILLQASIDSNTTMEIFAVDKEYRYLTFNSFHQQNMKLFYKADIHEGQNYLDYIENYKMRDRIKTLLDQALSGKIVKRTLEIEVVKEKYLDESYTPIKNSDDEITGATIFSQDVTERTKHEQSIMYLSYRDPLTNLHNRRYYSEELDRLDTIKYMPLSIIIADINGLKITNDAFGHEIGDQLLITVASNLVEIFSKENRIARIGGDEFTIFLPNTSKERALQYMETAKKRIENNTIKGMGISVSFGVATKLSTEPIQEVIKTAEDDMYTHKLFEIASHRNETIKTIVSTLHEKNPREEAHSKRVSEICISIGTKLGMKSDEIALLKAISNLHDIGKIAIDDSILNKKGPLDEKEWEQIKKHPEIGYRILSSSPEYADIAQDILSHHERYDGKGYPRGLSGGNIPIRARIITIADSYDAMISERPYRRPMTHQEALEEIRKNAGTQFDPALAELFIKLYT